MWEKRRERREERPQRAHPNRSPPHHASLPIGLCLASGSASGSPPVRPPPRSPPSPPSPGSARLHARGEGGAVTTKVEVAHSGVTLTAARQAQRCGVRRRSVLSEEGDGDLSGNPQFRLLAVGNIDPVKGASGEEKKGGQDGQALRVNCEGMTDGTGRWGSEIKETGQRRIEPMTVGPEE